MGATIIRPRERVFNPQYSLCFSRSDGSGFAIDCDENGEVKDCKPWSHDMSWPHGIRIWAWGNFNRAVAGFCDDTLTLTLETYPNAYVSPALALCPCGAEIELDGGFWGTSCESCGRTFNGSGQELNPPHMWEEREYDDDSHTIAERLHGYDN